MKVQDELVDDAMRAFNKAASEAGGTAHASAVGIRAAFGVLLASDRAEKVIHEAMEGGPGTPSLRCAAVKGALRALADDLEASAA